MDTNKAVNVHNNNLILNNCISKLQLEFILIDHGPCPNWSRAEHTRHRDCMYLILDGQGEITINGKTIYPRKNNMVLLPKNSMVSLHSENETCYNKYWCDFILQIDGISLFDIIEFPYMIELDDISHALELFQKLDELHTRTDVRSAFMLNAAILELLSIFLDNDSTGLIHNSARADKFADDVNEFINANLQKRLSVKILAKKMNFNEKYFIAVFKKHFHTTPAQYIKALRLEKVKNELLFSNSSTSDIANNIGYSSVQKLNKDFRAYTGFSLLAFRQNFKD